MGLSIRKWWPSFHFWVYCLFNCEWPLNRLLLAFEERPSVSIELCTEWLNLSLYSSVSLTVWFFSLLFLLLVNCPSDQRFCIITDPGGDQQETTQSLSTHEQRERERESLCWSKKRERWSVSLAQYDEIYSCGICISICLKRLTINKASKSICANIAL